METVYQELSQHGQVLTFIYDTLIQDNLTVDAYAAIRTRWRNAICPTKSTPPQ
jgi:hypothetical protein